MGLSFRWFARRQTTQTLRTKVVRRRLFVKVCLVGSDTDGTQRRTKSADALIDTGSHTTIVPAWMFKDALHARILATPILDPERAHELRSSKVKTVDGSLMDVMDFACRICVAGGKGGDGYSSRKPVELQVRARPPVGEAEMLILGTDVLEEFGAKLIWDIPGKIHSLELRQVAPA